MKEKNPNKRSGMGAQIKKMLEAKDGKTKILSIVLAIILWFAISTQIYPTMDKTLYNVGIDLDLTGTKAGENSLVIVAHSPETADIQINGNRGQIGNLSSSDVSLSVDLDNVINPGTYKMRLKLAEDGDKDFTVKSITPEFVSFDVEKIITKEFVVAPIIDSSITIADGYMYDTPFLNHGDKISLTGPEEKINSITDVKVRVSSEQRMLLSASTEFTSTDIELYNNSVLVVNEDNQIEFDRFSFTVQIPVYVRQTLPLVVSISNKPDRFDEDGFMESLQFSAKEIDIAAPSDRIKDITSINIGTINLREVDIGSSFTFDMSTILPEGYKNMSGLTSVTVTCPAEGLEKKLIAIRGNKIQIINKPSQYDFELITSTLMPYFIGPESEISALTSADISCQVDLLGTDFKGQEGNVTLPVTFYISNSDDIWVYSGNSSLSVYVQATEKSDS